MDKLKDFFHKNEIKHHVGGSENINTLWSIWNKTYKTCSGDQVYLPLLGDPTGPTTYALRVSVGDESIRLCFSEQKKRKMVNMGPVKIHRVTKSDLGKTIIRPLFV